MKLDVDLRRLSNTMETLARQAGLIDFSVQFDAVEAVRSAMLALEEENLTQQYRPERLATFRAGRICAHRALAALGQHYTPILRDTGGAPIWPAGLTGSIAHTKDIAAAIVVRAASAPTIGIDLETDQPLEHVEILNIICSREEISIRDRERPSCLDLGKLHFVAKEATYKALWPIHRTYLDFKDVIVRFHGSSGEFSAHLLPGSFRPPIDSPAVLGRYSRSEGHYVAIACSATSPSDGATSAPMNMALTETDKFPVSRSHSHDEAITRAVRPALTGPDSRTELDLLKRH